MADPLLRTVLPMRKKCRPSFPEIGVAWESLGRTRENSHAMNVCMRVVLFTEDSAARIIA
jgi:hypothetical protein